MRVQAAPLPMPGRTRRVRRGLALALALLLLWAAGLAPLVSRLLAGPPPEAALPWGEVCHSPVGGEAAPRHATETPGDEACGYCKLFHRLPLLLAEAPLPPALAVRHAAPRPVPVRTQALRRRWQPPGRGPPGR